MKNDIFVINFYNQLPDNTEFTTADAVYIGINKMFICERTVHNYLTSLYKRNLLYRPRWGIYKKYEKACKSIS